MTARIALVRLMTGLSGPRRASGTAVVATRRARRSARATVLSFGLALAALNGLALVVVSDARVRDPEYGRRAASLRDRLTENPGRPLVVVVGSSRTAMGIRPEEWERARPNDPSRPDPLLFNLSVLGGGPVMELMTLRRLYADGFRPAVVLIEFWPPFLHNTGGWNEPRRIPVDRLMGVDADAVRNYFPEHEEVERGMRWRRTNPVFANRDRFMVQILSRWVPPQKRTDWTWDDVDRWGWKPGSDLVPGPSPERSSRHAACADIYAPLFAEYRVSPDALRAVREAVALARDRGAAVGFVFLPESSEFRRLYPPHVDQIARDHLATLSRELAVPVFDCRQWMDDGYLVDGFHLSRTGAAEFTRRFGPAVAGTFPNSKVTP